jgi:hypothetical protein
MDDYRLNWLLHLQRMPQNRIPLKSYHYRPQGRRTIGRPKKRWREQLLLWRWNGSKVPILDVYDDGGFGFYFQTATQQDSLALWSLNSAFELQRTNDILMLVLEYHKFYFIC